MSSLEAEVDIGVATRHHELCLGVHGHLVKRGLVQRQKRPSIEAKETCALVFTDSLSRASIACTAARLSLLGTVRLVSRTMSTVA